MTWSPKRVDSTNQKRLPSNAHAHRDVFQASMPWQEMVKLNKGSIFIITETQFAIQGQVMSPSLAMADEPGKRHDVRAH